MAADKATERNDRVGRNEAQTELEACHGYLTQLKLAGTGPEGQPLALLDRLRAIFDPLQNPELAPYGRPEDRLTEAESLAQRLTALEQRFESVSNWINMVVFSDGQAMTELRHGYGNLQHGLIGHTQRDLAAHAAIARDLWNLERAVAQLYQLQGLPAPVSR